MEAGAFHDFAIGLPGATFDVKWGQDRIYSVGGKMFAAAGSVGQDRPLYSFKASDMAFELLVEQGLARPAPYAARFKWVQLLANDSLTEDELKAYVVQAHGLIAEALPKKARAALRLA